MGTWVVGELMMMMNCFCSMVDRRKAFRLISSRYHCQRSPPSRISDTRKQVLSSGFVEWFCAVVITTTPRCHKILYRTLIWFIKPKLYSRSLDWKKIIKRAKQLLTKLLSLWCVHFVLTIQFAWTLASHMTVLHGNHAFSIFVPSIKKRYFSFLGNLFQS